MGNHEAMMRLALDPETPWADAIDALDTWIANGGDRTMAEFVETDQAPEDLDALLKTARAALPPRVRAWLESLRASWRSGDILFVHAGVNPQVELEAFLALPWNTPARQARRRSSLGVGALALSRTPSAKGASAGSSSSTAIRRTTPVAIPRTPIRSPGSASISTPAQG